MWRFRLLIVLILGICMNVNAQTILLPDEAVKIALTGNFDLQISELSYESAKTLNNPGTAGMLPSVSIDGLYGGSSNNIDQRFASGLNVKQNNVGNTNAAAGVGLTYTFFDGFRMVYAKKRLKTGEEMSELSLKEQIQFTIHAVLTAYFSMSAQKQQIKSYAENMKVSEERIKLAQRKFDNGTADKTSLLAAKLDYNAQKSAWLSQQNSLKQMKAAFNALLGRNASEDFDVSEEIPLNRNMAKEEVLKSVRTENFGLKTAEKNVIISKYSLKELQGKQYPWLSANAGYRYNLAQSQAGFALYNQNIGLSYGISLTYPIFAGFTQRPLIKNAKINYTGAQINFSNIELKLQIQAEQAFNDYSFYLEILKSEEENVDLARENMNLALTIYKSGSSNELFLREAQRSFEEAQNRMIIAKKNAKTAELTLMKLSGALVKK